MFRLLTHAYFAIVAFLLMPASSYAVNKSNSNDLSVEHSWYYVEDKVSNYSPSMAESEALSEKGHLLEKDTVGFGVTESAYWFLLNIAATGDEEMRSILIENHLIKEVDVFRKVEDEWHVIHNSGTLREWDKRAVDHSYFIFPLENSQKQQKYLVRVKNNGPLVVPISVEHQSNLQWKLVRSLWVSGLFWGVLLALIIYNAFLYFSTRTISYLYYITYNVTFLAYLSIQEPWSYAFFYSELNWYANYGIHIAVPAALLFALLFIIFFLNLKKELIKFYTAACTGIIGCLILIILFPFISTALHAKLVLVSVPLLSALALVIGINSWKIKNPDASMFLVAWGVLISGAITTNLVYANLIPFNWFTISAANIGGCIEMLLLSFALAASINRVRKQKSDILQAHHQALKSHALELSESNRYKDDFLNLISHELRTPLHGIRASLDLLRIKSNSSEVNSELTTLDSSTQDIERRISDILIYTDLNSGRFLLHPQPLNLYDLIQSLENKFSKIAEEKGNHLECIIEKNVPEKLIADEFYVRLIIFQVLDNAVKFTSNGKITLSVFLNDNAMLSIKVSDNGIGIEKRSMSMIERPFLQADKSLVREFGGLGLGLSLSYQLVEKMQGSISVESEQNQGTTIEIQIPIELVDHSQVEKESESQEQSANHPNELSNKTKSHSVLIVEDNLVNQQVMGRMITHLGYQAFYAGNGKEAYELCQLHDYDIILMDCQMPVMDGLKATVKIREKGKNKDTPIIAVTANAMSQDTDDCFSAGMDQHLSKPVKLATLKKTIECWLSPKESLN